MIKLENNWKSKTLENLEQDIWSEPSFESSLVIDCHRLRKVPLNELTPANLNRLIGQSIGLDYLIPLAIEELGKNITVDAYYYPGDLLLTVKSIKKEFWHENDSLLKDINNLIATNQDLLIQEELNPDQIKLDTTANS